MDPQTIPEAQLAFCANPGSMRFKAAQEEGTLAYKGRCQCLLPAFRKENRWPQVLRSHIFLNNSRKKLVRKMSGIEEPTEVKKVMWVSFPFNGCAHPASSASVWLAGGVHAGLSAGPEVLQSNLPS